MRAKSLFDADDAAPEAAGSIRHQTPVLAEINELSAKYEEVYRGRLTRQDSLSRSLVSFQANKERPFYRWFKYKEAFSAELVKHIVSAAGVPNGTLFDPFAGVGTALFAAGELGLRSVGIELLPIGQRVITTKQMIDWHMKSSDITTLSRWIRDQPWHYSSATRPINELRITKGAYPAATMAAIEKFLAVIEGENERVRQVLFFALLCVLERISFTRKDGQYLRWDFRSFTL
jgi:hypothetical protein